MASDQLASIGILWQPLFLSPIDPARNKQCKLAEADSCYENKVGGSV